MMTAHVFHVSLERTRWMSVDVDNDDTINFQWKTLWAANAPRDCARKQFVATPNCRKSKSISSGGGYLLVVAQSFVAFGWTVNYSLPEWDYSD